MSTEQPGGGGGDRKQNSGGDTHATIMTFHRLAGLRRGTRFNDDLPRGAA